MKCFVRLSGPIKVKLTVIFSKFTILISSLVSFFVGKVYFLKPTKQIHVVGRNGDLILANDNSISRQHCRITVENDSIYLEDLNSKYGTFVNENIDSLQRIEVGKKILVKNDDRIMFGRLHNTWLLSKLKYKIISSKLADDKKEKLKIMFERLSFRFVEAWEPDCTHLTMPQTVVVTLKLIHALVLGIPIVAPKFWVDVYKSIEANQALPDYTKYIPSISETYISADGFSLAINEKRKKLFSGKTFVFMYETQMQPYVEIIRLAGGECQSLNKKPLTKKQLLASKYICIQYKPQSSQSQFSQSVVDEITAYLAKNQIRVIPEQEIGSAILQSSIKDFCNPQKRYDANFVPNSAQLKISHSKTLVQETQAGQSSGFTVPKPVEKIRIPDSEDVRFGGKSDSDPVEVSVTVPETQESTGSPVSSGIVIPETQDSPENNQNQVNQEAALSKTVPENQQVKRMKRKAVEEPQLPQAKQMRQEVDDSSSVVESIEIAGDSDVECLGEEASNPPEVPANSMKTPESASGSPETPQNSRKVQENPFNTRRGAAKPSNTRKPAETSRSSRETPEKQPVGSRKRPAFVRIDSDEDDDENLFNFDYSLAKKQKCFVEASKDKVDHPKPQARSKFSQESPKKQKSPEKMEMEADQSIKATPVSTKSSIDWNSALSSQGWLSKKMGSLNTSDTGRDESQIKREVKDEDRVDFVKQARSAFQVNVVDMDLKSNLAPSDSFNTTSSSKKNFKAFVKKQNYKPQSSIVPTVIVGLQADTQNSTFG